MESGRSGDIRLWERKTGIDMYVECKNVKKVLKKTVVLHDINIHMEGGHIYGLWGKNGCGKTMLMRAISGLLCQIEGSIEIDGKKLGKEISFPPSIGVLIEQPSFLKQYTGLENLRLIASVKGIVSDDELKEVLERVGLDAGDKRKYYKYSLGMKQRLGIACAIMEKPDLIILDEPVNALDEEGIRLIHGVLTEEKARGALVLLACHDREEMNSLADEIFVMRQGTIIDHVRVQ